MEINQLMQVLRNGRRYTITPIDGEPYQVLEAPNQYMIKACRIIQGMTEIMAQRDAQIQQLQRLLAQYPDTQTKELTKDDQPICES